MHIRSGNKRQARLGWKERGRQIWRPRIL